MPGVIASVAVMDASGVASPSRRMFCPVTFTPGANDASGPIVTLPMVRTSSLRGPETRTSSVLRLVLHFGQ